MTRLRAWEAILYLLVARYYSGKDDPIGAAAAADRDFLADSFRKHSPDDEALGEIEGIYQQVFDIIKTGRLKAAGHRDEDDAPIM